MPVGTTNIGLGSTLRTEMGQASGKETSLQDISKGNVETINTNSVNRPDGSAPFAMSEFQNYDHNAGALTKFNMNSTKYTSPFLACQTFADLTSFADHNGTGTYPTLGDTITISGTGVGTGNWRYPNGYITTSSSVVTAVGSCGRSERRYKQNIKQIGTSPMGIPVYEFEYKNKLYGSGKYVGTMADDLERLGFTNAILNMGNEIWVDYNQIDVDFKKVYK